MKKLFIFCFLTILAIGQAMGQGYSFGNPWPAGGANTFLRNDGTGIVSWQTIAGGGSVTSVSVVTANGFSGTVANSTTTPAITIIAGAITPNTVVASDATTPHVDITAGSTNTGYFLVNGKTSGSLKITTADATARAITLLLAAQTVGIATLTIPDMANTNKTVAWLESPVFTTPNIGSATGSISGNAGTATKIASAVNVWGQSFDGSGAISGTLTGIGNMTGGASSMTITAGTGASRTMALQSTTSGSTATTFLTGNADQSSTFGGNISGTGAWGLTGGAGNMTILSGTGASRTMIFQTTTSGSAATTFLTGNADQSATFANTVNATTFVGALTGTASGNLVSGGALGTPSSGTLTNCTFPTLNQATTNSAASLSTSGQTGLMTITGLTSTNRIKTVSDAADVILERAGSYSPTGTWTSMTLVTPALGTPASGVGTNITGITAAHVVAGTLGAGTYTFSNAVYNNNPIAASGNAATVPITSRLSTVTNNSAATCTVTLTTTSAQDGQLLIVRFYDFSAVAETITWVNTEVGEATPPATSNGSTTLPKTVWFMFNSATTKWRCVVL